MKGKTICKTLKEIRQQIAEENEIEYITSECHYQGDCSGTCPKCEAELAWLEKQLKLRKSLGKAVVLTGIAMGAPILAGCHLTDGSPNDERLAGDVESIAETGAMPAPESTEDTP